MTTRRPDHLVLTCERSYDELRGSIDDGTLTRLRRGAYLLPHQDDDEADAGRVSLLARCHAVAATLGCRFAFSHRTAAALHGWPVPTSELTDILQTVSAPQRRSRDVLRHRTTTLPDEDIEEIGGLPVTSRTRTAVDCALACPPGEGLAVADAALRELAAVSRFHREESLARQDPVRALLTTLLDERGRVRHVKRARAVLASANGLSESASESWLRWLALSRGMPEPELQMPIPTLRGLRYPDAMWLFDGRPPLLAEYDGADKYRDDAQGATIQEKDREQLLRHATGGEIVRFTAIDRRHPEAAWRRLLDASPLTAADLTPRPDLLPPLPRRP